MSFFVAVVVAILNSYLAFTNVLADRIIQLLPAEQASEVTTIPPDAETGLRPLLSEYGPGNSIPDILLRNSSYQQAALLASAGNYGATTNNPLEALVNIYCTLQTTDTIRTTTGTGVFVHASGVILTNAHVAQYLLLENIDRFTESSCIIRTGDPATPTYVAELLYLPPTWIQKHAALIDDQAPSGTGERDYALLYVTRGLQNQPLPQVFPALAVNTGLLPRSTKSTTVIAAGYPANNLQDEGRDGLLRPRQATTTVSELYTFGSTYADVFSLRGSSVGQQGSSGGPVIAADGRVIGLISTRGDDTLDGEGSLRAITISHINRTITSETGFSLERNLGGDLPYRAALFNQTLAPFLQRILVQQLQD